MIQKFLWVQGSNDAHFSSAVVWWPRNHNIVFGRHLESANLEDDNEGRVEGTGCAGVVE
jgi:hypothetical protein